MNNKPRYSIFKNARYALEGLIHAFKSETSFKLEIFFTIPIMIAIYLLPFTLSAKMFLVITLMLIMIVELLNSGIKTGQVGNDYGLNVSMISRWKREYKSKLGSQSSKSTISV